MQQQTANTSLEPTIPKEVKVGMMSLVPNEELALGIPPHGPPLIIIK